MALPLYLAMTYAEIRQTTRLPENIAWMACHFSAYSTGLSNFPEDLPPGSMIIVNDRTPACGHDPGLIAAQLQQLTEESQACGILLDFQRPDDPLTAQIVKTVADILSCPVGISPSYVQETSCPVFLDPLPLHTPLSEHIAPWEERAIWLDVALDATQIDVYEDGSRFVPLFPLEAAQDGFEEPNLHCRYQARVFSDHIQFSLWRTQACILPLLLEAEALGVRKAFGLYQQLGSKKPAD